MYTNYFPFEVNSACDLYKYKLFSETLFINVVQIIGFDIISVRDTAYTLVDIYVDVVLPLIYTKPKYKTNLTFSK